MGSPIRDRCRDQTDAAALLLPWDKAQKWAAPVSWRNNSKRQVSFAAVPLGARAAAEMSSSLSPIVPTWSLLVCLWGWKLSCSFVQQLLDVASQTVRPEQERQRKLAPQQQKPHSSVTDCTYVTLKQAGNCTLTHGAGLVMGLTYDAAPLIFHIRIRIQCTQRGHLI